jgi:hypothetical protein
MGAAVDLPPKIELCPPWTQVSIACFCIQIGIGFELLARIPKSNSIVIQTIIFELWLFQYYGCFGIEPNSIPTLSIIYIHTDPKVYSCSNVAGELVEFYDCCGKFILLNNSHQE